MRRRFAEYFPISHGILFTVALAVPRVEAAGFL